MRPPLLWQVSVLHPSKDGASCHGSSATAGGGRPRLQIRLPSNQRQHVGGELWRHRGYLHHHMCRTVLPRGNRSFKPRTQRVILIYIHEDVKLHASWSIMFSEYVLFRWTWGSIPLNWFHLSGNKYNLITLSRLSIKECKFTYIQWQTSFFYYCFFSAHPFVITTVCSL